MVNIPLEGIFPHDNLTGKSVIISQIFSGIHRWGLIVWGSHILIKQSWSSQWICTNIIWLLFSYCLFFVFPIWFTTRTSNPWKIGLQKTSSQSQVGYHRRRRNTLALNLMAPNAAPQREGWWLPLKKWATRSKSRQVYGSQTNNPKIVFLFNITNMLTSQTIE